MYKALSVWIIPIFLELIHRSRLTGSEGGHNVKKFIIMFVNVLTRYVGHIEIRDV